MASTVPTRTVEVVMFRARPGVDDARILEAADALQREVEDLPGYLGRRLLKDDDGQWLDVVDWSGLDEALQASEAITQRPIAQAFDALVDGESMRVLHLAPVRVYGSSRTTSQATDRPHLAPTGQH
jgi:hypothetical protein